MTKKTILNLVAGTLFALAAGNTSAQITFDAASAGTAGTGTAVSTVTWSHTVGDSGPDRMLVVGVAAERTSDPFPASVTFGSQPLTKVTGSRANQIPGVSPTNSVEIWYLPAPAIGTGTITVTFATSVANGMECGAVSLFGVNQSAPEAVAVANGATSGTTFTNVITTLTAGAWLVDVANSGAGAAINTLTSTTTGLTRRWNGASGLQLVGAGGTRELLTAGTVTNTWVSTGSSRRAQSTAAFAPAPPSPVAVAITSPTNTAVVSSSSFSVNAIATVNPGSVTNVAFYLDATLVGNDTSYPFSFVVSGASAGAHTLTAVATSGGISATSAVVNVTAANLPPTVAITSPGNGSPVLVGASVPLTATATDDSAVTNVDFYVDGALVGSDNSNPYNATWASATLGAHALTAVASDNGGLSTTSSVVNITGFTSFAAYEPFNYGSIANGTATTASGFTGNWTCGTAPSIVTGMTYTGLPVANSALSSGSGRQSESFLAPLSGGTEYVSFLLKASGNMGGNIDGVYFPNGGTGLFFGFGLAPNTGTQGGFGLGSTTTTGTAALGAANLASSFQGIYGNTYLVVLKIDFNTSGNNDTVTAYINPTANSPTPPAATYTVSSFDVGTITGIGLTVQGGATMTLDEIRRGSTYGEVVGYNPPATPTGLVANAGVNSVSLSWTAVSGATGYNVLRGTSTGVYNVTNSVASNTNYDATAVGGTQYFYVVQATNASGASANSSEVTATPTIALPNVPTGVTATGTNGAVSLSWSVAVGAASYNVKRSTTSNTEVTITNVATTSYYDTDVVNGTAYFYKISSTNAAGQSANSSEVTATPNTPPAAPTGLAATAGTNQVALAWTGSAGAASYNVKRSTTSGSGYVTIGTTAAPTVAYTDSTAVKFTTYYYVVSAVSAYGESPNSSPEATSTPTGTYAPSAYEPFNYATLANGNASTAAGFTGNWTIGGSVSIIGNLTYPSLTTANNAFQQVPGAQRDTVSLATPLASGTKYISFLYNQAGDNGGNRNGLYLPGSGATSLFVGPYPWSGVAGVLTLSSVTTASGSATGTGSTLAQMPGPTQLMNYNQTNLIVLRIDFNTSGTNDTVSLWLNPSAGTLTPAGNINAPNPDLVVSNYDVGTITGIGFNFQGGAAAEQFDEFRIGDTYGDVSGYVISSVNTSPTNIVTSVAGNQLTLAWPADHIGWKLQSQTNSASAGISTNWSDVAGSAATNQMTFTIDPANPTVFYRMTYP